TRFDCQWGASSPCSFRKLAYGEQSLAFSAPVRPSGPPSLPSGGLALARGVVRYLCPSGGVGRSGAPRTTAGSVHPAHVRGPVPPGTAVRDAGCVRGRALFCLSGERGSAGAWHVLLRRLSTGRYPLGLGSRRAGAVLGRRSGSAGGRRPEPG